MDQKLLLEVERAQKSLKAPGASDEAPSGVEVVESQVRSHPENPKAKIERPDGVADGLVTPPAQISAAGDQIKNETVPDNPAVSAKVQPPVSADLLNVTPDQLAENLLNTAAWLQEEFNSTIEQKE